MSAHCARMATILVVLAAFAAGMAVQANAAGGEGKKDHSASRASQ